MKGYSELKAMIERRGVHDVFGGPGEFNWFIEQNPHELARFLQAIEKLDVRTVLEIGTGYRAGLARFLSQDMGWKVTSLDRYMPISPAPDVEFLMGRSEILRPLFDDRTFDLVIIDADHRYESVKRDHELYADRATKAVMFHDIAGLRDCEGAKQYWEELVAQAPEGKYEAIAEGDQRAGIGWIVLAAPDKQEDAGDTTEQAPPAQKKPTRKKKS